jgi:hypothetical protein
MANIILVFALSLLVGSLPEDIYSTPASTTNKAAIAAEQYRMMEYNMQETSFIRFNMGTAESTD